MKGIFIPAFYKSKEEFEQYFEKIVEFGFDFVEIGIPFSEPVADGPVISKAYEIILENNVKVEEIFKTIEKLCEKYGEKIKIYIMTYSNIIFDYGISEFSIRFREKIKGLIIADCSNRMGDFFKNKGLEIPIIAFITPESREIDIENLKNSKADFIYCVGLRGITGSNMKKDDNDLKKLIVNTKKIVNKPVVLGFGIKTKKDTEFALKIADGFVIGTEAVRNQTSVKKYIDFLKFEISE